MPVITRRVAVAGVLTATAIAVPAAALAADSPTSKAPTTAAHSSAAASGKPQEQSGTITPAEVAARLASRLGVSKSAAEHALQQLRRNMTSAQFAAVAHQLGVTPARLNTALREVKMSFAPAGSSGARSGGTHKPGPRGRDLTALPAAAALLASRLGVSLSAAQHAMHQLGVLSARDGGVDSTSPQFRAIAHGLGVTTAQLDGALRATKEHFAER